MVRLRVWCLGALIGMFGLLVIAPVQAEYVPRAERVAESVYAIVGPLGQRSKDNAGLNANYGFVVTPDGVVLIDSGASERAAKKLEQAIRAVTERPVRWVVNTGSQDHRWLGNAYFAGQGAEVMALARTAATQAQQGSRQIEALKPFLGDQLEGTVALPARRLLEGTPARMRLGGVDFVVMATDAHFPGDSLIHLPQQSVVFAGDLVYVDRLLSFRPDSSLRNGQGAFKELVALAPARIVPGHGRVCDLAQAQRETGDYYDFLMDKIVPAARAMDPLEEVVARYAELPAFRHLENYDSLHRFNMNRIFTEFEGQ